MLPRRPRTTRRRSESGASAVEFALILPVFVVIIAAILDFGFIFAQQVQLNNAARDAARAAVVKSTAGAAIDCQTVVSKARGSSKTLGLSDTSQVGVTVAAPLSTNGCAAAVGGSTSSTTTPCTSSAAQPSRDLSVTLTFTSQVMLPLPYLNSKLLTATGVFQCEYS